MAELDGNPNTMIPRLPKADGYPQPSTTPSATDFIYTETVAKFGDKDLADQYIRRLGRKEGLAKIRSENPQVQQEGMKLLAELRYSSKDRVEEAYYSKLYRGKKQEEDIKQLYVEEAKQFGAFNTWQVGVRSAIWTDPAIAVREWLWGDEAPTSNFAQGLYAEAELAQTVREEHPVAHMLGYMYGTVASIGTWEGAVALKVGTTILRANRMSRATKLLATAAIMGTEGAIDMAVAPTYKGRGEWNVTPDPEARTRAFAFGAIAGGGLDAFTHFRQLKNLNTQTVIEVLGISHGLSNEAAATLNPMIQQLVPMADMLKRGAAKAAKDPSKPGAQGFLDSVAYINRVTTNTASRGGPEIHGDPLGAVSAIDLDEFAKHIANILAYSDESARGVTGWIGRMTNKGNKSLHSVDNTRFSLSSLTDMATDLQSQAARALQANPLNEEMAAANAQLLIASKLLERVAGDGSVGKFGLTIAENFIIDAQAKVAKSYGLIPTQKFAVEAGVVTSDGMQNIIKKIDTDVANSVAKGIETLEPSVRDALINRLRAAADTNDSGQFLAALRDIKFNIGKKAAPDAVPPIPDELVLSRLGAMTEAIDLMLQRTASSGALRGVLGELQDELNTLGAMALSDGDSLTKLTKLMDSIQKSVVNGTDNVLLGSGTEILADELRIAAGSIAFDRQIAGLALGDLNANILQASQLIARIDKQLILVKGGRLADGTGITAQEVKDLNRLLESLGLNPLTDTSTASLLAVKRELTAIIDSDVTAAGHVFSSDFLGQLRTGFIAHDTVLKAEAELIGSTRPLEDVYAEALRGTPGAIGNADVAEAAFAAEFAKRFPTDKVPKFHDWLKKEGKTPEQMAKREQELAKAFEAATRENAERDLDTAADSFLDEIVKSAEPGIINADKVYIDLMSRGIDPAIAKRVVAKIKASGGIPEARMPYAREAAFREATEAAVAATKETPTDIPNAITLADGEIGVSHEVERGLWHVGFASKEFLPLLANFLKNETTRTADEIAARLAEDVPSMLLNAEMYAKFIEYLHADIVGKVYNKRFAEISGLDSLLEPSVRKAREAAEAAAKREAANAVKVAREAAINNYGRTAATSYEAYEQVLHATGDVNAAKEARDLWFSLNPTNPHTAKASGRKAAEDAAAKEAAAAEAKAAQEAAARLSAEVNDHLERMTRKIMKDAISDKNAELMARRLLSENKLLDKNLSPKQKLAIAREIAAKWKMKFTGMTDPEDIAKDALRAAMAKANAEDPNEIMAHIIDLLGKNTEEQAAMVSHWRMVAGLQRLNKRVNPFLRKKKRDGTLEDSQTWARRVADLMLQFREKFRAGKSASSGGTTPPGSSTGKGGKTP